MRTEMSEFKSNLKDEIDSTQNPAVQKTMAVADLVLAESTCARAVKEMQRYDKEFDLTELHYEVVEVFKEFFCNYLAGNLEFLQKVSGGPALAIAKGEI